MTSLIERTNLPLARFERVHTTEADEARSAVAEVFCDHDLTPLDGGRRVDTRFHSTRIGHLGLNYLDYGAGVQIAPKELSTFYLVLIPLAGRAEIDGKCQQSVANEHRAAILPSDDRLMMRWSEGSSLLILRIERVRLEEHLRKMVGRPLVDTVQFDVGMDLDAAPVQSWRRVVNLLLEEVDSGGPIPSQPLVMADMERLLLSHLLLSQPNNYSGLLHRPSRPAAPITIRRAADLIEEHAAEPLTVEDIAAAVGVSVRVLQDGFRRYLGTTPMSHLRDVRLGYAREHLKAKDPSTDSVTDIAMRWGFVHPSRFSVLYRRHFGESPSETLRN